MLKQTNKQTNKTSCAAHTQPIHISLALTFGQEKINFLLKTSTNCGSHSQGGQPLHGGVKALFDTKSGFKLTIEVLATKILNLDTYMISATFI